MSNPSASFTPNAWPNGIDNTLNHAQLFGTIAVAPGTSGIYQATGVPINFNSNIPGYNPNPFWASLNSIATGFRYAYDPVSVSLRIFQTSLYPAGFPPTVVTGSFAASANWGTSPTLAPSATSNQEAFSLSITAQNSTGANPTITLTFPDPYDQPPIFVCNRGDALSDAGYFVFTSSTNTTAVFTFVGTPTATHVYVLQAIGKASNLSVPAITTAAFTPGAGFGTTPTLSVVGTSTQDAWELSITAQSTTAANPTLTITFPTPYASAPVFSVSRADVLSDAGYWVVTSTSLTNAVFTFVGTPTATHVYKVVALLATPAVSAVTAAAFAASANFGTSPTLAPTGNQFAFNLNVTAQATTGANPTITLTFPTPLGVAPNFVCSRSDALSDAGYWVVTSTSTTTAVFTFIGTPTATHVYGLSAIGQNYSAGIAQLATGAVIPASVLADSISVEFVTNRT